MRTTKTAYWLLALILGLYGPQLGAQEKAKKARATDGGAPVSSPDGEEKKAAPAGQIIIDWDEGQQLKGVPQIVKRLYRLKKTAQWSPERLPRLCELCLATGNAKLKMYATWYQALCAGHDQKYDIATQKLKEAVALGYQNVIEMQESEELAVVREAQDVKDLIAGLEKKLQDRMIKNFHSGVDANLAAAKSTPPKAWSSSWKTLEGAPLLASGKPMVVVLGQIREDSLEQYLPRLKRIQEKIPVGLLLYQYDAKDTVRGEQARKYVVWLAGAPHRFSTPAAIVGRADYLEIRSAVQGHFAKAISVKEKSDDEDEEVFREAMPFTILVDGSGAPLVSTLGVQEDWQVDYLLQKIGELPPPHASETPVAPIPPPAPPPAEEKPPVEKPVESKPAPEAAPAPTPAPIPPPSPPVEEKKPSPEPEKPAEKPAEPGAKEPPPAPVEKTEKSEPGKSA